MRNVAGSVLAPGTMVAGYRVESLIGRGGMGVVYRAEEAGLGRKVALKVIAPELARDERFRERFLRESRVAASLDHPHVIPIYQAGEEGGLLFLAMRYVRGADLEKLVASEGALEPGRALELLSQVAEALDAAHEQGLVHRDVKPSNVLIAEAGGTEHCYLGDFGLTKRIGSLSGISVAGDIVGTLEYVAPEQITGEPPDERSDVYSLGCVLYECLTGHAPFPRATDVALLWAHVHEEPTPPSTVRPDLPRGLDAVLARALAKEPEERYRSAGELLAAARSDGRLGGRASFAAAARTNLPRPASSFVGREAELTAVRSRLEGGARLLTLTGPGGTGKTRLALEAAWSIASHYEAGAFWVGLASLRDPTLVMTTIAQALEVEEDRLVEHIGERAMLILLDNLEQVIDSAPELSRLLQRCPNLTVLATSRALLRLQGEVEYPVPPLAELDAVSLFCERSRLEPSEKIANLCARLDNLPLAVELAAARTKALTPAQLLERLSGRLDLLEGGRDADPRHQTLRATIKWSYDLLSESEQRALGCLSVFAGGCTLEAAEEVCEADVDTLQSLVEKSLLRFSNERFWILETIRELALEELGARSDADAVRRRHASFFLDVAQRAEPHLHQADALVVLVRDEANFRAALAYSRDQSPHLMLQLVGALWRSWYIRGQIDEGRSWLEEALERAGTERSVARAHALRGLALTLGPPNADRARTLLEEAIELYGEHGNDAGVAFCLHHLGDLLARSLGPADLDRATEVTQEALALHRELEKQGQSLPPTSPLLGNLADIAQRRGDLGEARRLTSEWLDIARIERDDVGIAAASGTLAYLATLEGDYEEAARFLRPALRVARMIKIGWGVDGLFALASVIGAHQGRTTEAAKILGALEAQRDRRGAEIPDDHPFQRAIAAATHALDGVVFDWARAEGRELSLEETLDLACKAAGLATEGDAP